MRASNGSIRWRPMVGVLAMGVFAFSLTLQGEPKVKMLEGQRDTAGGSSASSFDPGHKIRIGPGVPVNLRVLPPVVVDYRNDPTSRAIAAGEAVYAGMSRSTSGGTVAAPGDPCRLNAECDDCNPCTMDSCSTGMCNGGEHDGDACDQDEDCAGVCEVVGNDSDGDFCWSFLDCCGPPGGPHGDCLFHTCDELPFEQCVNWKIPYRCKDGDNAGRVCDPAQPLATECPNGTACDPGFEADSECDDELECNGHETCLCDPSFEDCQNGTCQAGADLCGPGTVCDEDNDSCGPPCTEDWHCENDGFKCTDDRCDVGGTITGTIGQCYVLYPCGPGGGCTEPINPEDPPVCDDGRCCDAAGTCTAATFDECEIAGDDWLATEDPCIELVTDQNNICPAYGSGIAPQGDCLVEVGRITSSPVDCGHTVDRLGDDYTVDSDVVSGDYMDIEILRFAASVQVAARIAIEFWDISDPQNPMFIEDTFYPSGTNRGVSDIAIHTLLFSPPLTIPTSGVVALSVATNFGPLGAISWVATDVWDVGTNNVTRLFVNGAVDDTGMLGVCALGGRDGEWCDTGNGDADCPNGTCGDIDDVLAFEIVAAAAGSPEGACCVAADGTCDKVLPWVCEKQGNVFQGVGTGCKVCMFDPFGPECLETYPDCMRCADDTTKVCVDTADCISQGAQGPCEDYGPCVDVPPACLLKACCDPATGDCVEVSSPTPCPDGFGDLGFGSFCEGDNKEKPNCCPQPTTTGGDNCLLAEATTMVVNVPAVGGDPVQVTTTGNNSTATFDDYTTSICVGGDHENEACDPDAQCDGGTCTGRVCEGTTNPGIFCTSDEQCDGDDTCTGYVCEGGSYPGETCDPDYDCLTGGTCTGAPCIAGIFNPDGNTRDPGWWESFSLSACANVRIDLCCSEIIDPVTGPDILRPAWAQIYAGCPCSDVISNVGVPVPIGRGWGDEGYARGGPFCSSDNLWMTFGPLPKGTYYYPIYSGWQGTYAVENGGGTYQFHVTAGACPMAACCGEVCVGGDRNGLLCDPSGIAECPNGECVGGVCVNGDLDGMTCNTETGEVIQCPGDGAYCGEVTGCDIVNQLVCEAFGGFWLAGLNLPVNYPVDAIVSCGSGTELDPYICDTGACCVNPGDCRDDDGTGGPMDEGLCEGLLGGEYVGGAGCYDPEDPDNGWVPPEGPCPVCPAANYPENCQSGDLCSYIFNMDRQNGGSRIGDDFIAVVPEITQFCLSPCFLKLNDRWEVVGECSDPGETPPDDFEIRFYEDNNGFPGAELPNSPGPVEIAAKVHWGEGWRCWDYAIMFDPPIGGFVDGQRYWIEFSASGSAPPPDGTGCTTYLHGSLSGNGWSLREYDHFGKVEWDSEDIFARHEIADGTTDEYGTDFSFCIDGGLEVPPPMTGACCECDGTCTPEVSYEDCMAYYLIDANTNTVTWPGETIGTYYPAQLCADIECEDIGSAGGGCPGEASGIVGEDCDNPLLVGEGTHEYSNLCSTTDGVGSYAHCDNQDNLQIMADKWFEYHSCGSEKKISIDLCGGTFDAVLAVYTKMDCVGGSNDGLPCTRPGTECPDGTCTPSTTCPTPDTKLCVGGSNPGTTCTGDEECLDGGLCSGYLCSDGSLEDYLINGLCYDDECTFLAGNPTMQAFAEIDSQCFLIRAGGYANPPANDALGDGMLEISCGGCFPSTKPAEERLWIEGDMPSDPINKKIRVLSFSAGDPGRQQAIRVNLHQLPPAYSTWEGLDMWVGPLTTYCENSGQDTPPQPAGCGYPGKDLPLEFAAATLQCEPYFTDWTRRYCLAGDNEGETCTSDDDCGGHTCWNGFIHVYHEGIVPSAAGGTAAQYDIDVVEVGCIQMAPEDFSPIIRLQQSIWGDCVKDLATEPARPPDGSVGVTTDVTGVLDKFKNISSKQPLTSVRSDVAGGSNPTLDMKIEIIDVTFVLDAFKGGNYPPPAFGDPSDPPCDYQP